MKQVISVRDLEEMLRQGKDLRSLPADAILTPSARDRLREYEDGRAKAPALSAPPAKNGAATRPQPPARPLSSKSSRAAIEEFFQSPYCHDLKLQICDVGRRLWQRAYVD